MAHADRKILCIEDDRETAGLIWSTAREALEELRGIIGVLRDGAQSGAPSAPQPSAI